MSLRRSLAALVAVLTLTISAPAQAVEVSECAEGLIHVMPFCFTPDDLVVFLSDQAAPVVPRPVYVAGVEQWRSMVAYYWPPQHVDRMLRIMNCESRGIPTAKNPHSSARGLFQIMGGWQKTWPGDYFDPWTNAAVAYQIWRVQGYGAWVCRG